MTVNEYLYDIQPHECKGEFTEEELRYKIQCGNDLKCKLKQIENPSDEVLKRIETVERALDINLDHFNRL